MVLWGQWIVVFTLDTEPKDSWTRAAEVSQLRFSKLFSCWPNSVSATTQGCFPTGFNGTHAWRLLKCPPSAVNRFVDQKPKSAAFEGRKLPLRETFGVLLLFLCSVFLVLVVCKHGCPVPENSFRCTTIWREFLSTCVALQSCFSCSLLFEMKRDICAGSPLKFLCNPLDFALN